MMIYFMSNNQTARRSKMLPCWAKSAPGWWDSSLAALASTAASGRARPTRCRCRPCGSGPRWIEPSSGSKPKKHDNRQMQWSLFKFLNSYRATASNWTLLQQKMRHPYVSILSNPFGISPESFFKQIFLSAKRSSLALSVLHLLKS